MSVHRRHRRGEADGTNDQQNYRPGLPEIEIAGMHLTQEKEDAHGYDDGGAHQAANSAAAARAANAVTHRACLPLPAFQPVTKHQDSDRDQDQRPELHNSAKREEMEIVQEKQRAEHDQNDRTNRAVLAPTFERVGNGFPEALGLGDAHGIDGHIKYEA